MPPRNTASPDAPDGLWDSPETAAYLNVPVRTLDQWAYRRVGPPYYKIGRFRRYRPVEVEEWLQAQAAPGVPAA